MKIEQIMQLFSKKGKYDVVIKQEIIIEKKGDILETSIGNWSCGFEFVAPATLWDANIIKCTTGSIIAVFRDGELIYADNYVSNFGPKFLDDGGS